MIIRCLIMSLNTGLNLDPQECDKELDVTENENLVDVNEHLEGIQPCVGMEFASHKEAKMFYLRYAKFVGFGVSIKASRRSKKTYDFIDVKYACTRYGNKKSKDVSNPRPCLKIDCKATLHVKKKNEKWIVHDYIKEHNHELLPSYAHYFPCHRNISSADKNTTDELHSVGVQTNKIFTVTTEQYGGYENVGFMEKDIRNHLDKQKRLEVASGDAKAMLEHFTYMQEEDPNFFYAMDLDENQRLRNVFWVDAKGREDYKIFGDVVSFDTTYIANKYKMPFAPFIGVNNHFQSTLLGCALLADETTSTFIWLMKTWIRAMGGKSPAAILTDQDSAMKSAIAQVFPNSRHHFCLWHILGKIPEKLGHVTKNHDDFMVTFNRCIYNSSTSIEFEKRWRDMINRYNLVEDEWLESLFKDRLYWVPTYMRETFFGGMSPTQRSESINSFFDKYVKRKTSLKEFVEQYKVALQDRIEKEAQADFTTWYKQPCLKSPSPFEKQMSEIYTHEIFKKFQVEVIGVTGCFLQKENDDNMIHSFVVKDIQKNYDFKVVWDASAEKIYCACHLFEYHGILCRHALLGLQSLECLHIPSKHILERWTRHIKSIYSTQQISKDVQYKKQRFDELFKGAIKLSKEGSISQESFEIANHSLQDALEKCEKANRTSKSSKESPYEVCEIIDKNISTSAQVFAPLLSKTKGAPKRIQSGAEKNKKIKRKKTKQGEESNEKAVGVPNNTIESSCPIMMNMQIIPAISTSSAPYQRFLRIK